MFQHTIPLWLQRIFPALTWKVKTNEQKVYFTFDDGPHPEITPWVLDTLSTFNAKATFFCVGDNVRKFPETYDLIGKQGHATGNHTFHHLNGWKTKNSRYFEDIRECEELIRSNLFRPPYGRITLSQIRHLRPKYRIIMWDILTKDYDQSLDPVKALDHIKKKLKPGSVVVFHDSEKAEKNLKILLPELLMFGKQKGFTFVRF